MLRIDARICSFLALLLLSSCARIELPAPSAVAPRFQLSPMPLTMTFSGSCQEDVLLLERWYGAASAVRDNLRRVLNNVSADPDPNYMVELQSLSIMRAGIADLPAPDCVRPAHTLLAATAESTLYWVQRQANEDVSSEGPGEQELRSQLELLDIMLGDLEILLYPQSE